MLFVPLVEQMTPARGQEESSRDYFLNQIENSITRATITRLED